jgi:hypothetical protein
VICVIIDENDKGGDGKLKQPNQGYDREKTPAVCVAPEIFLIPDTDDNENDRALKQPKRKEMEKGIPHTNFIGLFYYCYYLYFFLKSLILKGIIS